MAVVWQHKTSKSPNWHDFASDVSASVEELFRAKASEAKFSIEGRPYTIKFADMKQYSDTESTHVRLVRRVEPPSSDKRTHSALTSGEGPEQKVRRTASATSSMPTVTIYTLGGNAIWGPQKVTSPTTLAGIVQLLDRPDHSPGVKIFHGEELLGEGTDVSALSDPADLRAQFDPPKLFDHSFVKELVELSGSAEDEQYMEGDVVEPSELVIPHAEVVRAAIGTCSSEEITWNIRLRLAAASPLIASKTGEMLKLKLAGVKTKGGYGSLDETGLFNARIVESSDENILADVDLPMTFEEDVINCDLELKVVDGATNRMYSKHLSKVVHEGVSYRTGSLSTEMTSKLNKCIDDLKSSTAADYHPGSKDVVRDLVHPSLFPFVEGISETSDLSDVAPKAATAKDKWGRPYEASKYQWLPSEVSVSADGKCKFETYINNLNREKHAGLYIALEELLGHSLPHLESSWAHGNAVDAPGDDEDMDDSDASGGDPDVLEEKSLRGRTIQVITKIVDYEVPAHGVHEGVWHVEGMSHENIVATAELILLKDDVLSGGDLEFQRSFTSSEGGALIMGFPQCRPRSFDDIVEKGLVPLGHLPLPCGRLASWPNSHIHRVTPLRNSSGAVATRRIVVFWLINPDVRIVSTKHVAPQQGKMTLEEASHHRLALMEERKHHKANWNLREVTLCEH